MSQGVDLYNVVIPGHGTVQLNVPAGTPPEQVQAAIRKQFAPTVGSETLAAVDSGTRGLLQGLPGLIGDAVTGQTPFLRDVTNNLVSSVPGMPKGAKLLDAPLTDMAPSDAIKQLTGGAALEPQTTAGKIGSFLVGGGAAGAADQLMTKGLAGLVPSAVKGAAAGAAAYGGGAVGKKVGGPGGELAGQLLGGTLGGLGVGAYDLMKPNVGQYAQKLLGNFGRDDIAAALQAMRDRQTAGTAVNAAQAMAGVRAGQGKVPQSALSAAVDQVVKTPEATQLQGQLANQTQDVPVMTEQALGGVPGTAQDTPTVLTRAKEQANNYIRGLQQQAGQIYRSNMPQGASVPQQATGQLDQYLDGVLAANPNRPDVESLVSDVKNAIVDKQASAANQASNAATQSQTSSGPRILGPDGQPLAPSQPAQQLPNTVYLQDPVQLNDAIRAALDGFGPNGIKTPGVTKGLNSMATGIRNTWGQIVDQEAPQLSKAQQMYSQFLQDNVTPVRQSIVGRLVGAGYDQNTEAATSPIKALFDQGTTADPASGYSPIGQLRTALDGGTAPGDTSAFPDLVRSWMQDKWNRIGNNLNAGQSAAQSLVDEFGAPYQNNQRWQTTDDMIRNAAQSHGQDPDAASNAFQKYLETAYDMAQRPSSVDDVAAAQGAIKPATGLDALVDTNLWQKAKLPLRMVRNSWYSDYNKQLDNALATPDGFQQFIQQGNQASTTPVLDAAQTAAQTAGVVGTAKTTDQPDGQPVNSLGRWLALLQPQSGQ